MLVYLRDGSAQTIYVLPHWTEVADRTFYLTSHSMLIPG